MNQWKWVGSPQQNNKALLQQIIAINHKIWSKMDAVQFAHCFYTAMRCSITVRIFIFHFPCGGQRSQHSLGWIVLGGTNEPSTCSGGEVKFQFPIKHLLTQTMTSILHRDFNDDLKFGGWIWNIVKQDLYLSRKVCFFCMFLLVTSLKYKCVNNLLNKYQNCVCPVILAALQSWAP